MEGQYYVTAPNLFTQPDQGHCYGCATPERGAWPLTEFHEVFFVLL